ncbi:hypothetical protein INS49_009696 [Diaporthe citri]|uniref:uncharacterized protein n=1 Tax=Diaporthe citri TaxID=83186 RepID=UPI001C81DBBF|nr:uncharacterized protein INS49_009696 [Diaporthe citri]KAG6361469.1 hypothetical protein INS49_009696 [Diaporthe citri]
MNVFNASTAIMSLLGLAATARATVEVILCAEPSLGNCATYNVNPGGCVDLSPVAHIGSLAVSRPCSTYRL